MEKEDYVSLNVAKRLQKRGFKEPCYATYIMVFDDSFTLRVGDIKTESVYLSKIPSKGIQLQYLAPTLYEAQKWLREKHNIHVRVDNNASGWFYSFFKADNGTFISDYDDNGPNDGGCWDSYEEALNDGIMNALNFY